MNIPFRSKRSRCRSSRRGAALLVCLSIIFIVTLLVVHIFDTITIELSSVHNNFDYERALYLANAGVHAVAAELEQDPSWRGTVTDGSYPADDTYSATAVSGSGGTAVVTSKGVSHSVTRTITASFQL
jgi:Tfp pilus assembly protein PilX